MLRDILPNEILSDNEVRLIIKAINDSRQQYEHWKNERNLGYENGKYQDRWNYIFANIRDYFTSPFKAYPITRSPLWKFAILYNTDKNILFVVLREERFERLRRDNDSPHHYLRILNSQNYCHQKEFVEQLSFFEGFQEVPNQYIDENLETMIGEIRDEVKGCVNILFKENKDGVCKISGNIANYNLDILTTFDWSNCISADIEEIIDTKNDYIAAIPKIELSIKKDKIKNQNKEIVDDKGKRKEKQDVKEENKN